MLASLGETMKRESECNKSDAASRRHGMNNAHPWIYDVAVNADCNEYGAKNVEIVCSDTNALSVFGENEVDRAISLRECVCARSGAGYTRG
jgi:hypothetical protein